MVRLFKSKVGKKDVYYTILGGVPVIVSSDLVKYDEILEDYYIDLPIRCRVYTLYDYIYFAKGEDIAYFFKAETLGSRFGVINKIECPDTCTYYIASGNEDDPYDEALIIAKPTDEINISWSEQNKDLFVYDWQTILKNGQEESHCLTEVEVAID